MDRSKILCTWLTGRLDNSTVYSPTTSIIAAPSGPESDAESVDREKKTMAETMAELETVYMEEATESSSQLDVTLESKTESFVSEGKFNCCFVAELDVLLINFNMDFF